MEETDIRTLEEMRRQIEAFQAGTLTLGRLETHLTALRDLLKFADRDWSRELTNHIVTLDSASTAVATDDEQTVRVRAVIATAIADLLKLIDDKLRHPSSVHRDRHN